ncbi:Asp23/Gls24 family envelope stress response protein [Streptomyces sp. NP160]|uniref:Asp23/Gls24 family envelope stress response protein n=1 Tax=Streptomyces sp. NP160 TaxID=2586637 RepID=UPI001117C1BC|nr:Asp23/Gls24 family envelope stress response protein [Streptomyces sp. NP160]TNM67904.1 Asp23/Gls24 family envelope stress response protein [Streptomyces sp. NP160]
MTGEELPTGGGPVGAGRAADASPEGSALGSALGAERLAAATAAMRQHTDHGWEQVRGEVVAAAMRAFRPSTPVRAVHGAGSFTVASERVVAQVRRALDPLPDASADAVRLATGEDDRLERVTVSVVAAYGSPLLGVADEVRRRTAAALEALLGVEALGSAAEAVVEVDVHIGGVEVDPRRL